MRSFFEGEEDVDEPKGKYDGLSDDALEKAVCERFKLCIGGCPLENAKGDCRFEGWRKIAIEWLEKEGKE